MAEPKPLPANQVVDVAIVGAGPCGLALARTLTESGFVVLVNVTQRDSFKRGVPVD